MAQKITAKLEYGWRLFATGLCFVMFGLMGVSLSMVLFPLLSFMPCDLSQKRCRCQSTLHYAFYGFIGLMRRLGVMTYEIEGLEKLNRPGQLIIANHPTLLDSVFLISRVKQSCCIVKGSLRNNPFMRGSIIHAGYICNDHPEQLIEECVAWLRSGGSMIIFPEGTRSTQNQPYRFQRGAAAIALRAHAIVTPVTLTCCPSTLTKAERWYEIPDRRFHLTMHVGDDIALDDFISIPSRPIGTRLFTRYQQDYFNQRRALYEHPGK